MRIWISLFRAVVIIFSVGVLIFLLMRALPVDPLATLAGGKSANPELIAELRAQFGLDQPLFAQLGDWLFKLLQGDFGISIQTRQNVLTMIGNYLPITLQLLLGSLIVIFLISVPLGVWAGANQGGRLDQLLSSLSMLFGVVPIFFSGILVIQLFGTTLNWLPTFGEGEPGWDRVVHLLLPCLLLGLQAGSSLTRMVRSSVAEAMDQSYIRLAAAKGAGRLRIVWVHAFRASWMTIVSITAMNAGYLLVQAVLVEYTFGISGFGSIMIKAAQESDYNVVQACALVVSAVFVAANTLADWLHPWIDPRLGEREENEL
ncbi:ABC transporter permease [Cohnella abietis]|uniref:Peptide ABC transporter permease n=1 Tax=Cohnella abietis TaxID=2507935 RepID=A0A3T1DC08_9BACL|nr:ABC transporter permease [Cohnella abietis]BBI35574.1 peptide ABC transporter permease [Cohnella abietis]